MIPYTLHDIQIAMTIGVFSIGVLTFLVGIIILLSAILGRSTRTIATQATRLAQKGLAEEVAGLVGNASSLLTAMNGMVNTSAGIGVFITIIGLVMMAISFSLVFQIK